MQKELKDKFEPIDVIAIIFIVCCFTMIAFGNDGLFINMLNIIIGFYFGRKSKNGG